MYLSLNEKQRVYGCQEHPTNLKENNLVQSNKTFCTEIGNYTFVTHFLIENVKYFNLAISNFNKRHFHKVFKIVKAAKGYTDNGVYFTQEGHYALFQTNFFKYDTEEMLKDFWEGFEFIKENFEKLNYIFGY